MVATTKTELRCDVCGNLTWTIERAEHVERATIRRPITGLGEWRVLSVIPEERGNRFLLSCSELCHLAYALVEAEWIVAEAKAGLGRVLDGDPMGSGPCGPGTGDRLRILAQARETLQKSPVWLRAAEKLEAG